MHSRISRLVFGASEPRSGAVVSQSQVLDQPWLNHKVRVEGGVLAGVWGDIDGVFRARQR